MLKRLTGEGMGARIGWIVAIVLISASTGMLLDWRASGISRYSRDWLMRTRGTIQAPDDIAIVAIDEASIKRFGRFPWPRTVLARAIDAVAATRPKAIALDVLFTDPTTPNDDGELAQAIAKGGNVVVAAQLTAAPFAGEPNSWLLPLPAIAKAAAAVGHVNVLTESEGIARAIQFQAADDAGRSLRAMPFETIRIAEGISERAIVEGRNEVILGSRVIPVEVSDPVVSMADEKGSAEVLRASRMSIDYIGPAGSFAQTTYSVADLLDGKIPASKLSGRYVLIGSTAASMGDRLSSPFIHHPDIRGDQHGVPMPGVEVLANALNTILRSRFYTETPGWIAFLGACGVAALTLGLLTLAQGRYESLKQLAVLSGVAIGVVVASYLAFVHLLMFPPMTPCLVSFASAGVLGLLRRSLVTSAALDVGLAQLTRSGTRLGTFAAPQAAAESIARLTAARGVAIYVADRPGEYSRIATHGIPLIRGPGGEFRAAPDGASQCRIRVEPLNNRRGLLVLAFSPDRPESTESLRIALAIAESCAETALAEPGETAAWWIEGLESKARRLGRLNTQLLENARFVECALSSVEDGLIISAPDGCILFANRSAAAMLGSNIDALVGRNLIQQLADKAQPAADERAVLSKLLLDRATFEREITIMGTRARRYTLRLTAVSAQEDGAGPLLGVVASLSDITRQHELQQTKNDVIALVSHEMRTPLTAIQGMTELLADYDIEQGRRRDMHRAINDEVKRLTRMITEYLDITRLEAGATGLRCSPVRVDALVERCLLLIEPLAAERQIRLTRRFIPVDPLLADPDLLSRAVHNLISNAIKYSATRTEVTVTVRGESGAIVIEVADQGYGIAPGDLDRIFQKFFRVPRLQDADIPGTGLGLAFVREIAERHGGSVTVRSEIGKGSVFTLRIPPDRGAAAKSQ